MQMALPPLPENRCHVQKCIPELLLFEFTTVQHTVDYFEVWTAMEQVSSAGLAAEVFSD